MKLLYVTGEAAPYAASGGLGDVMGSLPSAVKEYGEDYEVAVVLPLYAQVSPTHRAAMTRVCEFTFPYAWRTAYCGIYKLTENGVDYYFIDNEQYFKRPAMYGQFDDGERYAYFCHAVIELMLHTGFIPDVLHANDWQAALSVVYLKTRYRMHEELKGIKTVFTIHNIEYQGRYGMHSLSDIFDIGYEFASMMEYSGDINLLKGAVVCADRVNTVSPNYARELTDSYFAYGMEYIIRDHKDKMSGIINGLDVDYFNPQKNDIPVSFSVDDVEKGKAENKMRLQEQLGLPVSADVPMIAMITRLTEGKGIDLLLHVFDELLSHNLQFILLGTGDKRYEQVLEVLCMRHGDRARALLKFDRSLSKEIYASADFFLMPSKTEPCGLAQMIACRYGTIPIVHGVGGLADSIIPYGEEGGNGFVFRNFNAHDMLFRIKEALALYEDKEALAVLRKSAMTRDFTWRASALQYIRLYQS